MRQSWLARASSSRYLKPSAVRSRSHARRTFAATPCSAASARKASAIGASSSTWAPRSRPPSSRPAIRRGGGCVARTSGRRGYPRCSRRCSHGCARWTASGSRSCARSRSDSACRVEHFDGVVLPRGDPHLKIIRYPAQPRGADTGQGVGMHHDSGLVSFVLQDDVGGLQVELDGKLVDATPKPGTYVMNLGEMLQAATRGYLRATKHRVQSPPSGRERVSVAYFFHPRLDAVFAPIELPPELAAAGARWPEPRPERPDLRDLRRQLLEDPPALAPRRGARPLRRPRPRVRPGAGCGVLHPKHRGRVSSRSEPTTP